MRRRSFAVSLLLISLLLGVVAPAARAPHPQPAPPAPGAALSSQDLLPAARAVADATVAGQQRIAVDMVLPPGGGVTAAVQRVADLGGRVLLQDARMGYVQAEVPVDRVMALGSLPGLRALGVGGPNRWRPVTDYAAGGAISADVATADLATNLAAIEQPALVAATGATGRHAVIAVIDSGIDPGHPALQTTSAGEPKIVDWRDFTGEGDVDTRTVLRASNGFITAPNGRRYNVTGIPSASGNFHFGLLSESRLDLRAPGLMGDLNHNARSVDDFGVLVTDSSTPGEYDTVYVDGNNSGSFADKAPLVPWRIGQSMTRSGGRFGGGVRTDGLELSTNFAIADVSRDGTYVSIGFDGYGHGTGVASLAAGSDPESGYQGVAPGAQVMALKVLTSSGGQMVGAWNWISVKSAMTYAAEHGAQIINFSLRNPDIDLQGEADMSAFLRALVQQYGVLVVMAAGNDGPGLSSGLTPGDDQYVMTVGAYVSPDMWRQYRQLNVPTEGLLDFSGVGPRLDGTLVPSVVAPGLGAVAMSRWQSNSGYWSTAGTSVAVPAVTGGAALLLDAAQRAGISVDYTWLKRSLEQSARPLDGYQVIEQGHGLINLQRAWQTLQELEPSWRLRWSLAGDAAQQGVLARGQVPDDLAFALTNDSDQVRRVTITADAPWLQPQRDSLTLPPGRERTLPVQYGRLPHPGLYSGLITLSDQAGGGPVAQLISTVVSPYLLGPDFTLSLHGEVPTAHYDRRFVRIPAGMTRLAVDLAIRTDARGNPLGRARMHVFRPDGREVFAGDVAGAGAGTNGNHLVLRDPTPGIWEVVIVSEPDLGKFQLDRTAFDLNVAVQGFRLEELPLRLRYRSGGSTDAVNVAITNLGAGFSGSVEASGFARSNDSSASRVVPADYFFEKFELSEGSPLLRISLAGAQPGDAQVYAVLSHYNLDTNQFEDVATGTLDGPSLTLDVPEAPAGLWTVTLVAIRGKDIHVQYSRTVVAGGKELTSGDLPRQHPPGDTWNVPLQVQVPAQPGRYVGTLGVRDASGVLLAVLPVEVDVGQPELSVNLVASGLAQGQDGFVTLEVRDAGTDALLQQPTAVEVDGRVHHLLGGRLTLPVSAAGPTLGLDVDIAAPPAPYIPFQAHLEAAVPAVRPVLPTGVAMDEDQPLWRQKVATETQP